MNGKLNKRFLYNDFIVLLVSSYQYANLQWQGMSNQSLFTIQRNSVVHKSTPRSPLKILLIDKHRPGVKSVRKNVAMASVISGSVLRGLTVAADSQGSAIV